MTVKELILEYFPDINDDTVEYILYAGTGYPGFFKTQGTLEECMRPQLAEIAEFRSKNGRFPTEEEFGWK